MANENETQWEDSYKEETENQEELEAAFDVDAEEADTQENQDEYESDEEDEEKYEKARINNKAPMAIILILLILLAVVGAFLLVKLLGAKDESKTDGASSTPIPAVEVNNDKDLASDLGNSFFNENFENSSNGEMVSVGFNDNGSSKDGQVDANTDTTKNDSNANQNALFNSGFENAPKTNQTQTNGNSVDNQIAVGKEQDEALDSFSDSLTVGTTNNSIMVAWNKAARQNPFKPPVIKKQTDDNYETFGDVQFEIIEPPTKLVPDKNLEKLLQTQISGILYDDDSPSAIVKLAGVDQFVKIGDELSGYKIKNITRNKVEISYKNNTYVASVGELFVPGKLESRPAVANLSNKFAGRYKDENTEEQSIYYEE